MNKKLIKTITSITCGLCIVGSIPFISTSCGCSKQKGMFLVKELDEITNPNDFFNFDFKLLENNLGLIKSHDYASLVDEEESDQSLINYFNAISEDFSHHLKDGFINFIKAYFMCWYFRIFTSVISSQTPKQEDVLKFNWKVLNFSKVVYTKHKNPKELDQFCFSAKFHLDWEMKPGIARHNSYSFDLEVQKVPFYFNRFFLYDSLFSANGTSSDRTSNIVTGTYVADDEVNDVLNKEIAFGSYENTEWSNLFSDLSIYTAKN